jgi:mono/diheme cytochrome c family protein
MTAFDYIPRQDIRAVIEYIKTFAYLQWKYREVGEPNVVPEMPADILSQGMIDSGRTLYTRSCIQCHDDIENGRCPPEKKDLDWVRNGVRMKAFPRNFAIEPLRRGRSFKDIYTTLHVGIAGTSMGPYGHLREEELWQLVAYIRYLISKGTSK